LDAAKYKKAVHAIPQGVMMMMIIMMIMMITDDDDDASHF